jgi:hypothetical protein
LVATPKPRIVKLVIAPQGEDLFATGIVKHKATHYVVKVDIGGVVGVLAELGGKQPPDTDIWILGGQAPSFVALEGPFFGEGGIWKIDLESPTRQGPA